MLSPSFKIPLLDLPSFEPIEYFAIKSIFPALKFKAYEVGSPDFSTGNKYLFSTFILIFRLLKSHSVMLYFYQFFLSKYFVLLLLRLILFLSFIICFFKFFAIYNYYLNARLCLFTLGVNGWALGVVAE